MRASLRLALACIASGVAQMATPAFARAQSLATPQDIARSDADMHAATVAIDAAASRIFRAAGDRYTSPRVVGYQDSIRTACGVLQPENAYACRLDGSIYYDRAFIAYLMRRAANRSGTDGSIAVIFPVAHEWGHALQYMLGLDYTSKDMSEHDADCLAGVLISASRGGAPLTPNELADAGYTMQLLGDPPMATGDWARVMEKMNVRSHGGFSNALGVHGNSAERLRTFRDGLSSSVHECVDDVARFGRTVVSGRTTSQAPAEAPVAIHWFVNDTQGAYALALAQHKPLVLATGGFDAPYFQRLKAGVFTSAELAQLAPYAIFAYADPSKDLAAKQVGALLHYDKWPDISLLAPDANALDEEARIVGWFDAATVTTQLSKHMRENGWLPSATTHSTSRPPWMPPLPR